MICAAVYGHGASPEPGHASANARPAPGPAEATTQASSADPSRTRVQGRWAGSLIGASTLPPRWWSGVFQKVTRPLPNPLGSTGRQARSRDRRRHRSPGARGPVALLPDDVERAVLALVVDAPDVLANHPKRD